MRGFDMLNQLTFWLGIGAMQAYLYAYPHSSKNCYLQSVDDRMNIDTAANLAAACVPAVPPGGGSLL